MRDILIKAYFDWRNNYLTVEKYAEHNGLSLTHAAMLIALAEQVMSEDHPDA